MYTHSNGNSFNERDIHEPWYIRVLLAGIQDRL